MAKAKKTKAKTPKAKAPKAKASYTKRAKGSKPKAKAPKAKKPKANTPIAQPNDQWGQDFAIFKTAYRGTILVPGTFQYTIFDAQLLRGILNQADISHIAIFPIKKPNVSPAEFDCVAVAVGDKLDSNGNPIPITERKKPGNLQYVVALHNCPPDCTRAPNRLVDRANLRNINSID